MPQYTEQDLLGQIDSLADGDEPPTTREFENCPETASSVTVGERFDSWNEAVRLAGYVPREINISEQELLDQIDSLADGDEPPTMREFRDCPETASAKTVAERFDSWNEAVRLAGYPTRRENLSEEDLLNQISSLADGDEPPTTREFENCPETASVGAVRRTFGTWCRGVEAAGYEPVRRHFERKQLFAALQRAASTGNVDQIRDKGRNSGDYPCKDTYKIRLGGVNVAAVRGSIDIDNYRKKAIPLTKKELNGFIDSIIKADPLYQAVALVALLTGCDETEHRWVDEYGIEDTETDPVILFPTDANRGSRSVAVGPLYNQFVKNFDSISTGRVKQSIEFTNYPLSGEAATGTLRRLSRPISFNADRPIVGEKEFYNGPQLLHRDLRCTHYLYEYCRGTSQTMLKRRLALSDNEIEHYHRFLDDPESKYGWSVRVEWRD